MIPEDIPPFPDFTIDPKIYEMAYFIECAAFGDKEAVESFLIKNGASILATPYGDVGQTLGSNAILIAVQSGAQAVVELLLQNGVSVNIKDEEGTALLTYAVFSGDVKLVEYLLNNKADVNAVNYYGDTAFGFAVMIENFPIMQLLLSYDADVNVQNLGGFTPLMRAAGTGSEKVLELLLAHGADDALRDKKNMTAEDYARKNEHENIIAIFEERQRRRDEEKRQQEREASAAISAQVEKKAQSLKVLKPKGSIFKNR